MIRPLRHLRTNAWRRATRLLAVSVMLCAVLGISLTRPAVGQETTTTTAAPSPTGKESGLTISPAIVDNTVNAGTSFVTQITLGNITPRPVPVEVNKGKLETDQQPNDAFVSRYDISSWFTIDPPAFLLGPQDRTTVNVRVDVPANAEPGGHYGTVYFVALASSSGDGAGETLLNARVGVVFLLTVRGETKPGARIDTIKTSTWQLDAGATTFAFGVQNTGNVHFQPEGHLVVRDVFGRKVKSLPMPIGYILPGGSRQYDIAWERGLRPGIYTAKVEVQAGVPLKAVSKRFVIVPLILFGPVLLLLLVGLIMVMKRKRRKKRKAARDVAVSVITTAEPNESAQDIEAAHEETHEAPDGGVPPSPS